MWKNRILYFIILFLGITVYIAADRKEALILLLALLIIPLLSFIIHLFAMHNVKILCSTSSACRLGQTVPIIVSVKKGNRLPTGLIRINMLLENLLFAEKENIILEFNLDEEKKAEFEYPFFANNCGILEISISDVLYYDLLGLFKWHRKLSLNEEIKIYPPKLRINTELSRQPATKNFGEMYDWFKKGNDVNEAADLRDYIKGDSMKSVHWKLSGKFDKMIVREFGLPSNYNTLILYEIMKSEASSDISDSCNNAVLAITVSLSCSIMEMGLEHEVGRINAEGLRTMPVNSLRTHEQMTESLLYMPITEKNGMENTALAFMNEELYNSYTKIIYITPAYDNNRLRHITGSSELMVIHIVENKKTEYVKKSGYEIILINADDYMETIHNIVL